MDDGTLKPPPETNEDYENAEVELAGQSALDVDAEGTGADGEDGAPDAGAGSGAGVIESPEEEEEEAYDPMLVLELGDRVIIDSTKYGRTIGTIYYRSGELIRILPDGVSDRLYDFPRIYTDDEDKFDDELGVTVSYILAKRSFPAFVEQHDIRVGQRIETITKEGELGPKYSVETVDPENDTITVKDETGETQDIAFEGIGIPTDLPFVILRKEIGAPTVETAEGDALAPPPAYAGEVGAEDEEDVLETPEEGEDAIEVVGTGFIEVPKVVVYREARAADKVYTDIVQKIDALSDFMSMLDPAAQKDPRAIRVIRLLVETMFTMKYDLVDYNPDGSVKGAKPLSVDSISQLMERVNVPLARVVIDSKKRILKYTAEEDNEEDELAAKSAAIPDRSEAPDDYYVIDFLKDLDAMNANIAVAPATLPAGVEQGSTAPFWLQEQTIANKYMRTWEPNSLRDPVFTPKSDTDVFRRYIPDFEAPQVPGGFEPDMIGMRSIPLSIQRALTTTYRKGADRRKVAHIGPEVARAKNYLLFPIEVAPAIGTTRSGSLAIDSGRSHNPLQTLRAILKLLDGIQEVTTSKGILALGVAGNTIGNIPLNDYLEGIAIPGTGFGAADQTLVEYGLDQLELTPEILTLLNSKFTAYQEQLISTLARLRKEIADEATAAEGTTPEPVMKMHYAPADAPPHILEENIRSEPILVEDISAFERQNQALVSSDIALVAYLLRKHADYFQVAAGKQPVYTARERLRATRDMFIESLRIAQVLRKKREEAGEPPEPNKCEHVAKLRTIRKIRDEQERYSFLTKFFAKYQGNRKDNWINCNICEKELMCVHERIQLQAFLSPKEKDQLQKEIILNFADGVFQGHFICRNCGQPIQELGYDTHLEYDDEGRPMAGRSVLVDKDALRKEEIDAALSVPADQNEEFDFKNPTERLYYKVIFEIANRVGVTMDRAAYKRVMDRVNAFISKLPSLQNFIASAKSAKERVVSDYKVSISRNMICASALFLLIEIQTRIPDYVVRYALPGCVASFAGYPLITNEADKRGLQYLACAVASVSRDEDPWNNSGFFGVKVDRRREAIQTYMERILSAVMKDDVTVQQAIVQKLEYIRETFGSEAAMDRPMDTIPASFLPEQTILKATDEIIIPEVAGSMNSLAAQSAVAKAWILQAHSYAKKTASLIRGSPFSETTCCITHLQSPATFWTSASNMPALPPRRMDPSILQQSTVRIHFTPRKMENLLAETPEDLMYRTFLKVCFQGPRKGLPHEAGLTNLCAWCGFQFPGHPMAIDTDTEGKTALLEQSVNTSKEEFMQLLDRVHEVNAVPKYEIPKIVGLDRTFKELMELDPAPLDDWVTLMEPTLAGLKGLPPDSEKNDLIMVLGPLSDAIRPAEEFVKMRLKPKKKLPAGFDKPLIWDQLDALASMSWTNFFQVLLAYFVIPYRRLLTNFDVDSLIIPKELELGRDHDKDLLKMLKNDNAVVTYYMDDVQNDANKLVRDKLAHFLEQMTAILPLKTKIRAAMLPGSKMEYRTLTLQYIQQALLYGPLAELIDPNRAPTGEGSAAAEGAGVAIADASSRLILNMVAVSIAKASKERLTFNDEEIRNMIAVRKAKEEMEIVTMFASMSDDRRAAELTMKRLGIGEKWSIGGTKLVYAYDAGQYSREKAERARAGIGDDEFGVGADEVTSFAQGALTDEFGNGIQTEDQQIRDGGYDNEQMREDEY